VTYPQPHPPLGASLFGEAHYYRSVNGPAVAAMVLIALVVVGDVLTSVSDWRMYLVVRDYLAGAGASTADLHAAAAFAWLVSVPTILMVIAAGVMFTVWLWRARTNAELFAGPDAHRLSRGWVIGGWFCPVVNLWFPYRIVADIWRASAPARPVSGGLVIAWWWLLLAGTVVDRVIPRMYLSKEFSVQGLLTTAKLSTLSTVLDLAAGVLIIIVIKRITAWQSQARDAAGVDQHSQFVPVDQPPTG
jgi:hypothetical protein